MNQIHITRNGQSMGPYTLQQVNENLAAGILQSTDKAWHQGMAEWAPLSTLDGVQMPGASGLPPLPPPAPAGAPPPPNAGPPVASPQMGTLCPQCNSAVQPGQAVCMVCGSHIYAVPGASKKGAGKLIAIIAGSVVALALVAGGIYFLVVKGGLGRNKASDRIKCANNLKQIYTANLGFAQDNKERLPWQLAPSGVLTHLGGPPGRYGTRVNNSNNEVVAHPSTLETAGVHGMTAIKKELFSPKILLSPCDYSREAAHEIVQSNWNTYNTKLDGVSAELGSGTSYTFIRGADSQRPSSVLAITRNWSGRDLGNGFWLGSDRARDRDNARTIAGLNFSQGQQVDMRGVAKQVTNAEKDMIKKAARVANGGVAIGQTSLSIIRGAGL